MFAEKKPENIIFILLDQQKQTLREELEEQKRKLCIIENIRRELSEIDNFSLESIGDIAQMMKGKNELKKMRWLMVLTGIPVTALQWASIILWIVKGLWYLFALWVCVAAVWGIIVSLCYHRRVAYICPECHEVFRPAFREMFWAYHTPKMRRLNCPKCGHRGLCVEVYAEKGGGNNG